MKRSRQLEYNNQKNILAVIKSCINLSWKWYLTLDYKDFIKNEKWKKRRGFDSKDCVKVVWELEYDDIRNFDIKP